VFLDSHLVSPAKALEPVGIFKTWELS
jgi:hypothetical protein